MRSNCAAIDCGNLEWSMELRIASECARKKRAARAGVSAEPVSNLIRSGLESVSKGDRKSDPGSGGVGGWESGFGGWASGVGG